MGLSLARQGGSISETFARLNRRSGPEAARRLKGGASYLDLEPEHGEILAGSIVQPSVEG